MKSSEQDSNFLSKLNTRDYEAFKLLFRDYFQDITYYATKLLNNVQAAEDIAQEVFVSTWEKENHFENHLALKSYLYLSARNRCLNFIRHNQITENVHASIQRDDFEEYTWNAITETEIVGLLTEYIRQLPPECRKIMELVLQGYNSTEIAELTGLSSSTIRTQKQRGIAQLKKMLPPDLFSVFMLFCHL